MYHDAAAERISGKSGAQMVLRTGDGKATAGNGRGRERQCVWCVCVCVCWSRVLMALSDSQSPVRT